MSDTARLHNPGHHLLTIDTQGHLLACGETTDGSLADPVTARLVHAGRLLVLPEPEPAPVAEPAPAAEPEPAKPRPSRSKKTRARTSATTENGD